METKVCNKCLIPKSILDFSKDASSSDGLRGYCRACGKIYWAAHSALPGNREKLNARARERAAKDRDKAHFTERKSRIKTRYGLSLEDLEEMRRQQKDECLLCLGAFEPGWGKTGPSIDHCHKSGKVRGLLCHACNTALGKLQDSQEILARAIEYLKKNS